jgi:hypothetical protein
MILQAMASHAYVFFYYHHIPSILLSPCVFEIIPFGITPAQHKLFFFNALADIWQAGRLSLNYFLYRFGCASVEALVHSLCKLRHPVKTRLRLLTAFKLLYPVS